MPEFEAIVRSGVIIGVNLKDGTVQLQPDHTKNPYDNVPVIPDGSTYYAGQHLPYARSGGDTQVPQLLSQGVGIKYSLEKNTYGWSTFKGDGTRCSAAQDGKGPTPDKTTVDGSDIYTFKYDPKFDVHTPLELGSGSMWQGNVVGIDDATGKIMFMGDAGPFGISFYVLEQNVPTLTAYYVDPITHLHVPVKYNPVAFVSRPNVTGGNYFAYTVGGGMLFVMGYDYHAGKARIDAWDLAIATNVDDKEHPNHAYAPSLWHYLEDWISNDPGGWGGSPTLLLNPRKSMLYYSRHLNATIAGSTMGGFHIVALKTVGNTPVPTFRNMEDYLAVGNSPALLWQKDITIDKKVLNQAGGSPSKFYSPMGPLIDPATGNLILWWLEDLGATHASSYYYDIQALSEQPHTMYWDICNWSLQMMVVNPDGETPPPGVTQLTLLDNYHGTDSKIMSCDCGMNNEYLPSVPILQSNRFVTLVGKGAYTAGPMEPPHGGVKVYEQAKPPYEAVFCYKPLSVVSVPWNTVYPPTSPADYEWVDEWFPGTRTFTGYEFYGRYYYSEVQTLAPTITIDGIIGYPQQMVSNATKFVRTVSLLGVDITTGNKWETVVSTHTDRAVDADSMMSENPDHNPYWGTNPGTPVGHDWRGWTWRVIGGDSAGKYVYVVNDEHYEVITPVVLEYTGFSVGAFNYNPVVNDFYFYGTLYPAMKFQEKTVSNVTNGATGGLVPCRIRQYSALTGALQYEKTLPIHDAPSYRIFGFLGTETGCLLIRSDGKIGVMDGATGDLTWGNAETLPENVTMLLPDLYAYVGSGNQENPAVGGKMYVRTSDGHCRRLDLNEQFPKQDGNVHYLGYTNDIGSGWSS